MVSRVGQDQGLGDKVKNNASCDSQDEDTPSSQEAQRTQLAKSRLCCDWCLKWLSGEGTPSCCAAVEKGDHCIGAIAGRSLWLLLVDMGLEGGKRLCPLPTPMPPPPSTASALAPAATAKDPLPLRPWEFLVAAADRGRCPTTLLPFTGLLLLVTRGRSLSSCPDFRPPTRPLRLLPCSCTCLATCNGPCSECGEDTDPVVAVAAAVAVVVAVVVAIGGEGGAADCNRCGEAANLGMGPPTPTTRLLRRCCKRRASSTGRREAASGEARGAVQGREPRRGFIGWVALWDHHRRRRRRGNEGHKWRFSVRERGKDHNRRRWKGG